MTAPRKALKRQVGQAKAMMRAMRATIEDAQDVRTIECVKKASGNKPRVPGRK